MLLSSLHLLSSDRKEGKRGKGLAEPRPKATGLWLRPSRRSLLWCLSKLQQIDVLSGEFSALPAKNVKQRGLPSTWVFTSWIQDVWKDTHPLWIQSLYLFCKEKSHIQSSNKMVWARGDRSEDLHIEGGVTGAQEGVWGWGRHWAAWRNEHWGSFRGPWNSNITV